jgi:hypothetical protein
VVREEVRGQSMIIVAELQLMEGESER